MKADNIIRAVADESGLEADELTGPSRRRDISAPRQLAMLVIRDVTGMSWLRIGLEFDRVEASVWEGYRAAQQRMQAEPEYRALYDRVVTRLAMRRAA